MPAKSIDTLIPKSIMIFYYTVRWFVRCDEIVKLYQYKMSTHFHRIALALACFFFDFLIAAQCVLPPSITTLIAWESPMMGVNKMQIELGMV